jgi:hypothetical protein
MTGQGGGPETSLQHVERTTQPSKDDDDSKPARATGLEWLAVAAVVVAAAAIPAWWSRDAWFTSDMWDSLALREIGDVGDLIRPHHGHWQTPAIIQTRIVYGIAGMDFWPAHYLPKMLGWALMSVGLWWLMRRRGAHPVVALGATATVSVLGTSWYFHAAHTGVLLAIGCALAVATLVEAVPRPSLRHRVLLFGLLLLGVVSTGLGVAALVALPVALLALRRLRPWLAPVLAVAAIYGAWFIRFDVGADPSAAPVRTIGELPGVVAINARNAVAAFTGLPDAAGWPLLLVALGAVAWLAWRRRVTGFDIVVAATALVYLALVSRTRENLDRDAVATNVALLVAPAVFSHVRLNRRWMPALVGIALGVLAVSHAFRLEAGLEDRIGDVNATRPVVESMAALIARGEPYAPQLELTELTNSAQLTLGGLARLVGDGWDPGPPQVESEAMVRLRVSFSGTAPDDAPRPEIVGITVQEDGCAVTTRGAAAVLRVTGLARVTLRASHRGELEVVWQSNRGGGRASLTLAKRAARDLFLFGPRGGATVTLDVAEARSLTVCGVVAEGQG